MPFATVNNINLFYELEGEGKDLVLIGGLTANHLGWQSTIPSLNSKFRILRPDNRGAGQSDAPIQPYSIEDMADDIIQLMNTLDIEKAYVVGHSMGGMMAQYMMLHHPERIIKMMLCSTCVKVPEAVLFQLNTQIKLLTAKLDPALLYQISFPWIFGNHFLHDKNRVQQMLELMMTNPYPQSDQGYIGQVNALNTFDLMNQHKEIKTKTIIVVGEEDLLTPLYCSRYLQEHLSDVEFITLPKIGHIPHLENPKVMAQLILEKFTE